MVPRLHHLRLIAVLMAASALQACNTPLNVLAAIDGPYISPEQRAEMAFRAAEEARLARERAGLPAEAAASAPAVETAVAEAPALAPVQTAPAVAQAAAPEPAAPPAARPSAPAAAGVVGPVTQAEAPPAPLPTRLPSAFDLTPTPPDTVRRRPDPAAPPTDTARQRELERAAEAAGFTVVSAMPEPAGDAADPVAQRVLRDFFDFSLARLAELPSGGRRQSMLLADPSTLDPELKACGNLPPAVLIDLDPANGLMPLVSRESTRPELAGYLAQLRQRGVTVYWISGHGPGQASAIRRRLVASGLDPEGADPLIVTRFAGESKQERRYALGESNCLLAIMGDQRADFDELYDFVLDPSMAAPLEEHLGRGWFLAPPPLD